MLLDRGSRINKEITTKYRIVPFDADPWHIGFKHKPVTASTPTITLPEVLSQLSVRTAIASMRQLYMRLVHLSRSVPTTRTDSANRQPGMLSAPHQMYVHLRWNPALTSSTWAIPANTWTDLPFKSMGGQRNFNSFNLQAPPIYTGHSIMLDTAGLYLMKGSWRLKSQSSASNVYTALTLNDEPLYKDAVSGGVNNTPFTFLQLIQAFYSHPPNNKAKLQIQAYSTTAGSLSTDSNGVLGDREPPTWVHIAFLG